MRPRVSITRIVDQEEAGSRLLAEIEQHLADIRRLAFDYFERRGQVAGRDWDDWLRAERDLVWKAPAEMFQSKVAIVLRVAVPGFDPKSIEITVSPRAMLVQGREVHRHEELESRLHFCEFGQRLFRVFDLPAPIDPNTVSATLDKGILEIVAGIARRRTPEKAARASAVNREAGKSFVAAAT